MPYLPRSMYYKVHAGPKEGRPTDKFERYLVFANVIMGCVAQLLLNIYTIVENIREVC